jgi:hypothetical protein
MINKKNRAYEPIPTHYPLAHIGTVHLLPHLVQHKTESERNKYGVSSQSLSDEWEEDMWMGGGYVGKI